MTGFRSAKVLLKGPALVESGRPGLAQTPRFREDLAMAPASLVKGWTPRVGWAGQELGHPDGGGLQIVNRGSATRHAAGKRGVSAELHPTGRDAMSSVRQAPSAYCQADYVP